MTHHTYNHLRAVTEAHARLPWWAWWRELKAQAEIGRLCREMMR